MKKLLLFSFLFLFNCNGNQQLPEGTWTGKLVPMNHPEIETPMKYEVAYPEGVLSINVFIPDGSIVRTRDVKLTSDTLFYTFNEPEAQVELQCALAEKQDYNFEGRCSDNTGKWAFLTMALPQQ